MAAAVGEPASILGTWESGRTSVAEVLRALGRLRREVPATTATRTAVMTLVAVAAEASEAAWAAAALRDLGSRHPARTLLLQPADADADAAGAFAGRVTLHGRDAGNCMTWWEEVFLTTGSAGRHLDTLAEPFTLPDVPVAVWYVDSLPAPDDPLLGVADCVLVDSRDLAAADTMHTIAALASRQRLVDLSWVRLRVWRELLAALFDGDCLPFVRGVTSVETAGKPGPRRLLTGWLADRLALERHCLHLVDAEHASVRVVATADGQRGEFTVARHGDERSVTATVAISGRRPMAATRMLPPVSPAWGLGEALAALDGDQLYLAAIAAARALDI